MGSGHLSLYSVCEVDCLQLKQIIYTTTWEGTQTQTARHGWLFERVERIERRAERTQRQVQSRAIVLQGRHLTVEDDVDLPGRLEDIP